MCRLCAERCDVRAAAGVDIDVVLKVTRPYATYHMPTCLMPHGRAHGWRSCRLCVHGAHGWSRYERTCWRAWRMTVAPEASHTHGYAACCPFLVFPRDPPPLPHSFKHAHVAKTYTHTPPPPPPPLTPTHPPTVTCTQEVLRLARKHHVTIDSSYASLVIAVCVIVGFATSLDPRVNLVDAAVPALLAYGLTGRVTGRLYS